MKKKIYFLVFLLVSGTSYAQTYIDALRIDKDGKQYEMNRIEIPISFGRVWIDGIHTKVPWDQIEKIIVVRDSKSTAIEQRRDKVTLQLSDGRVFENISSAISFRFDNYLTLNPITGELVKKNVDRPREGTIILLGTTSKGNRKDSLGNVWPSYFMYSPKTGEELGQIPKHP